MQFLLPNPQTNPSRKFSTSKDYPQQDLSNIIAPSLQSLVPPENSARIRSRSVLDREADSKSQQVRFKRASTTRNPTEETSNILLLVNNNNLSGSEKAGSSSDIFRRGSKLRNKVAFDEIVSRQGRPSRILNDRWKDSDSVIKEEEQEQPKNKVDNRLADQCLLFISKEGRSASVGTLPQKPFQSFKELAGKAKESQQALLNNLDSYNALQETLKKNEVREQLISVKKLLEFNRQQQSHYKQEAKSAREQFMLPLIRRQSEESLKKKRMPPVRVYPFRNSFFQPTTIEDLNIKPVSFAKESQVILDEVPKDSDTNEANPLCQYKFFWRSPETDYGQWRPEVREGHTLTAIGKRLILYGGMSNASMSEVAVYNTVTQRWTKPDVSGDAPTMGRHGHSACGMKKGIIIFGGQRQYNSVLNYRECLNDVRIFTSRNEWENLRTNGKPIEGRRNHAAALYDSNLYVYGGINIDGKYLRDVWAFNLKSCVWTQLEAEYDRDAGVAYHTMSSCFEMKPPKQFKEGELNTKVPIEGIYTFGGRDDEGKTSNTIKVLTFPGRKVSWVYPTTKGTPPAPRYGHTMTVCEELGLLMIYGGKSENCLKYNDHTEFTEIFVLNLESMTWMSPASLGHIPMAPRYHHAATMVGSSMVVFGGLEPGEYAKDNLAFAEINQSEVRKLMNTQKDEEETAKRSKTPSPAKKQTNSILKEPSILFMDDIIEKSPNAQSQGDNSSAVSGKNMMTWLPLPNAGRIKRKPGQKSKAIIKSFVAMSTPLTERGTSSKTKIYT